MKFLIFATDVLPLPGLPTSGTALRTFGLAAGLRAHGHEVIESVPKTGLSGLLRSLVLSSLPVQTKEKLKELEELSFDASNQRDIVSEVRPDAILCGHWPAMTMRVKPSQALIIDLAGPHLLERHFQGSSSQLSATLSKLSAIATADYYIVSGPSQRLYFLSFMLRGMVERPESRIVTITMPLSPELPKLPLRPKIETDYPRFVFGGVFLPWQDPSAALSLLADTISEKQRGSLLLIGGKHPSYEIKEGPYTQLFQNLAKHPRITLKPMLPFEDFIGELSGRDVALDLMKWNLERELAVTIRTTTYLWAGIPVIYNNYADLGKLITQYDAGWCVDAADPAALSQVLDQIYAAPELVTTKSVQAQLLARNVFSWDHAVAPLLELISSSGSVRVQETDILIDARDSTDFDVILGKSIRQEFLCRINGLSRVECRITTKGHKIKDPVTFRLYQKDPLTKNKLLVERQETLDQLEDNSWFALEVPPIEDSAGRQYLLEIEGTGKLPGSGLSPWVMRSSPYPLGNLVYGESLVKNAGISLRTTCFRSSERNST